MKLAKRENYTYTFSYWHAFIIPVLIMVAGCIGSGIFPFGNQSFLRNDLYNQYMPFFQALHDRIWQGEGLSYSFELGLGSGFAALYGYYLASPSNWLVVLCPRPFIAEFITVVILTKMGLSGMSFAYYLRKHFGKANMGLVWFSSAYALSGFMAAYQWNIMWLDVVILAPLVLWALEELVEKGEGRKYALLLTCSIFTNFYLSIMLCIFLVLYFVSMIIWKPWRVLWRRCLQFGWYSLLAGGMTGVLLVPVYFALSGTEFHEFNFPDQIKWYMNGLEVLSRHCMGVTMKVQADHWPNIYCGVAIFLLVPMFLLHRKISWKEKISKLILAAFFLVSFTCNVLDFIWHGMNYPDSLPGRQSYLYTWLLLVMGYEVYLKIRYVRLWQVIISAILGYGIVISAWIFTDVEGTGVWTYVLTLVFLTVYCALLIVRRLWKKLGVQSLILVLVVVELACNTYITSIRTVNRTKYMNHFQSAEQAIDWMKAEDDGLYRTEIFERLTKNDGMMWDIKTATVFSSTANAGIVDLYKALGLGTTRVSYWYQGATPLVSAMLGVKYMIGKDDTMDNDLYDLVYSDDKGALYACNYSLPMGYVVDSSLEEEWDISTYNPVMAQNRLCRLLGTSADLLSMIDSTKVDEQNYTVTAEEDSYIYVYLGNNALTEVKMSAGNTNKKFTQVSFDYLLDLGYMKEGTAANLKVVKEDQSFKIFKAYKLNLDVLKEAIDILGQSTLHVTEHKDGLVKGDITMEESGKLVFSIPTEKGWTLYVNGQETPLESFKDALLAVSLDAGTYEIELEFKTPGVGAGLIISTLSAVIFALCWFIEKKRKVWR